MALTIKGGGGYFSFNIFVYEDEYFRSSRSTTSNFI